MKQLVRVVNTDGATYRTRIHVGEEMIPATGLTLRFPLDGMVQADITVDRVVLDVVAEPTVRIIESLPRARATASHGMDTPIWDALMLERCCGD